MLLFVFLLTSCCDSIEPTVMARPQGAPYVFYKEEPEDEITINLEDAEKDESKDMSQSEDEDS